MKMNLSMMLMTMTLMMMWNEPLWLFMTVGTEGPVERGRWPLGGARLLIYVVLVGGELAGG